MSRSPGQGVTVLVQRSKTAGRFQVSADGRGIEGRAGLALPVEVADRVGLTDALSQALGGVRSWSDHDPGVVARDLAVMLCDGGKAIDHLAPRQPELFGRTASQPTAWRTIEAIADDELARTWVGAALARVRGWVWRLPGGAPPVLDDDCDEPVCVDIDATLVTAHSDKDGAAGTYKGGYGFHPILAFVDRGTAPARRWRVCCDRATPPRTPPATTSTCSRTRWPRCPSCPLAPGS